MSKKYFILPFTTVILLLNALNLYSQTSYFVDQQNGSDSKNGLSNSNAFKSIDKATQIVSAGDTILIIGEYKNKSFNPSYTFSKINDTQLWHQENSIKISNLNGAPNAYITIKSFNDSTLLKGDGANIFRIQNSSYLRIENLKIQGEVDNIPLTTANALQFTYINLDSVANAINPTTKEIKHRDKDCINNCTPNTVVDGEIYSNISNMNIARPSYIDTRGLYLSQVHHIDIINNIIYNMPGGGMRVSECEDINIIGNEIHNCSRKSYSGTHALVVTKATSTRTTSDYRIKILKNKIHHNYNEQYSWAPTKTIITPHIDEGKGVSLQRNQTTYNRDGSIKINWNHGRILVQNNICYFNGFSGIHSNDGDRIDIINNTAYFNSYTKSITENITSKNGGNIGISAQGGKDIKIINNISIIDKGLSKSAISSNISPTDGLIVTNNIIYGTNILGQTGLIKENSNVASIQSNTKIEDPFFTNPLKFDFSLLYKSPAIGNGIKSASPTHDYFGYPRDTAPDIGAIEYHHLNIKDLDKNSISIKIFPNPAQDYIKIEGVKNLRTNDISIYNISGKNLIRLISINENEINISKLSNGVYILKINTFYYKIYKL